jgi:hypothetical protein
MDDSFSLKQYQNEMVMEKQQTGLPFDEIVYDCTKALNQYLLLLNSKNIIYVIVFPETINFSSTTNIYNNNSMPLFIACTSCSYYCFLFMFRQ